MKFLLFSFFFLSFGLFAQTSYVPPTKILAKKGYQLGISGEYFSTIETVDHEGTKFELDDGESFNRIEGTVHGLYGLTENLQIGGGIRFRQNNSTLLNETTGEEESETSSGVESTFAARCS